MKNWSLEKYRDVPLNYSWVWDEKENKFIPQDPNTGWKNIIRRILQEETKEEEIKGCESVSI